MAVIAGNLELAEVIKNYKSEEVGESELFILCMRLPLHKNILFDAYIPDSTAPNKLNELIPLDTRILIIKNHAVSIVLTMNLLIKLSRDTYFGQN